MSGHPELGVLLIDKKWGGGYNEHLTPSAVVS